LPSIAVSPPPVVAVIGVTPFNKSAGRAVAEAAVENKLVF